MSRKHFSQRNQSSFNSPIRYHCVTVFECAYGMCLYLFCHIVLKSEICPSHGIWIERAVRSSDDKQSFVYRFTPLLSCLLCLCEATRMFFNLWFSKWDLWSRPVSSSKFLLIRCACNLCSRDATAAFWRYSLFWGAKDLHLRDVMGTSTLTDLWTSTVGCAITFFYAIRDIRVTPLGIRFSNIQDEYVPTNPSWTCPTVKWSYILNSSEGCFRVIRCFIATHVVL